MRWEIGASSVRFYLDRETRFYFALKGKGCHQQVLFWIIHFFSAACHCSLLCLELAAMSGMLEGLYRQYYLLKLTELGLPCMELTMSVTIDLWVSGNHTQTQEVALECWWPRLNKYSTVYFLIHSTNFSILNYLGQYPLCTTQVGFKHG